MAGLFLVVFHDERKFYRKMVPWGCRNTLYGRWHLLAGEEKVKNVFILQKAHIGRDVRCFWLKMWYNI